LFACICIANLSADRIHDPLNLPADAPADDVRHAFKLASLKLHPDKTDDPALHAKFTKLSAAYAKYNDNDARSSPSSSLRPRHDQPIRKEELQRREHTSHTPR
jgi:curved DNA-binding protein CbpA